MKAPELQVSPFLVDNEKPWSSPTLVPGQNFIRVNEELPEETKQSQTARKRSQLRVIDAVNGVKSELVPLAKGLAKFKALAALWGCVRPKGEVKVVVVEEDVGDLAEKFKRNAMKKAAMKKMAEMKAADAKEAKKKKKKKKVVKKQTRMQVSQAAAEKMRALEDLSSEIRENIKGRCDINEKENLGNRESPDEEVELEPGEALVMSEGGEQEALTPDVLTEAADLEGDLYR